MNERTYESFYPKIGNIVIAQIKEIIEMGAYVQLLEYGNSQAMLMLSEISRRKVRSVNKIIKLGKFEVVLIIRVENDKGYIDVSKRQIADHENSLMEKKWSFSKNVNSITNHISKYSCLDCEDIKIRWIWLLYRKFGHALKGMKKIINKPVKIIIGIDIFLNEKKKLFEILKKKLLRSFPVISIEFELFLLSKNGVNMIKRIIEFQINLYKENKLEVRLIVPPLYIVSVECEKKKIGLKILMNFLINIQENLLKKNGNLSVKKIISI